MARSRNIISGLVRRFRRAVQRHGIIGMIGVAAGWIASLANRLRPSVRSAIREDEQRAAAFDHQFGVDTAGFIHPTALSIDSPNQLHAVSYCGSDPKGFRNAIGALAIDYHRFVFIDFGSGKGRAIMLATEFPFKRIVGVEFSEELHRIAQENIRRFRRITSKGNVKSVCMDAVDYPLPDDCLVCYFCNPFDSILMTQVLSNIRNSLLRNPREIFIVYYNPKEAHLVDEADCFRRVEASGGIWIWRTTTESRGTKEYTP